MRTLEIIRIVRDANATQAQREAAYREFDGILTRFEKLPNEFTPMEAMDLYQLFYVPREAGKMEAQIRLVAMTATLGWYDALRFTDGSGRAEIVSTEAFFNRALSSRKSEYEAFLVKEPQKAEAAVAAGILAARKIHAVLPKYYDVRWPVNYGQHVKQCQLLAGKNCGEPVAMPPDKWPAAFEDASNRVRRFYSGAGK